MTAEAREKLWHLRIENLNDQCVLTNVHILNGVVVLAEYVVQSETILRSAKLDLILIGWITFSKPCYAWKLLSSEAN